MVSEHLFMFSDLSTLQLLLVANHKLLITKVKQLWKNSNLDVCLTVTNQLQSCQLGHHEVTAILLDLEHNYLTTTVDLNQLQELTQNPVKVPIIALVSAGNESLGQQALQGLAQDYLVKEELDPKYVYHVLRRAIERQQLKIQPNTGVSVLRQSQKRQAPLVENISNRILAEHALTRRELYFTTLVDIQLNLLANPNPDNGYDIVIEKLGQVTYSSRVCIFENHYNAEGNHCMSQIAEWCAEGIPSQLNNPQLQNLPYQYGFSRWEDILFQGGIIAGNVQDLPKSEQPLLTSLNVKSVLILPLLVNNTFFGYISFDHCYTPRTWEFSEIKLLQAAAAALSLHLERTQAMQALAASEARYRSVVENAGEVIFQTDIHGNWIFLNEAWTEITGWEIGETIGRPMVEFVAPVDQGEILSCLESLATQAQCTYLLEIRYRHKNGKLHWLKAKIRSLRNRQGKVVSLTGTLDDITEQKLIQENLEQECQHLQQIITHAPVAMAMFDTKMRFLACSQEWQTSYNLGESILGKCLYETMPDIPEAWKSTHKNVLQGQPFYNPECIFERADGTTLYLRCSLHPWWTPTGEVGGMIAAIQIINELVEARETALATAQAKAQFFATMSHELRTPLNGIIGMAELLLETQLTFQQHDFLRTLHSSANGLLGLINNILDFSKVEAQELELDVQEFDLNQCLEEIIELLAIQALSRNNELFLFIDADVPSRLIGDGFRLRQVLLNLLGNALKFTEAGEIRIKVSVDKNCPQPQPGIRLRLEVQDTGIGIADEDQEKLFRAFSQANASIPRNYGGTGLGLMICKKLVTLIGGEIGVESQLGKGSTFWFTATFEVATTLPREKEFKPLAQRKLMAIDTNETFRDLVFAYTRDWGMETHTTDNLEEALVRLEAASKEGQPYDFAIVGLSAPAVKANQLGKLLSIYPYLNQTQWIAAIAINQHPQIPLLQEQGVTHTLFKPLKPKQLREVLSLFSATVVPTTSVSLSSTPKLRILVADDTPTNQKVILNQLQILGYSAEVVSDGQEALEKLEQDDYDLVFLDCSMPKLDGYEVAQHLRQSQTRNTQTVIIALTANTLKGVRERCLAAGMNDYLSKPMSLDVLKALLERWFPVCLYPEANQETPVNLEQLQEFCGEDLEFQKMVIQSFCEDAPDYLKMIQEAVARADVEAVERAAHRLQGAAATAAVYQLPELAKQLEEQASQGYLSLENTRYLLKRMKEILQQVEGFILDFRGFELIN
jgi:PAS domain S-box-containing protein